MIGAVSIPPKHLDANRRRALTVLCGSPDGVTWGVLLAHGFPTALLDDLVASGLATRKTDRVGRGKQPVAVVRMKITEVGRKALA